MKSYYIEIGSYDTDMPNIIDEHAMMNAERGQNYLNPDDYMFHCEANCIEDAMERYRKEKMDCAMEGLHP